eukprot:CAMPEP_0172471518 /NCGR_PEP_ID=MMETSP1065-20121228/67857_1 /TAXON_ID=265537 /ORGANISM="Amphiprora paludosa, Strain CCMP125" /LENGTH=1007 /DNA_ID=CAMNT_0013229621 /DNA_START=113 /DNA_END=3136 /DNA_ORIENTATION=+
MARKKNKNRGKFQDDDDDDDAGLVLPGQEKESAPAPQQPSRKQKRAAKQAQKKGGNDSDDDDDDADALAALIAEGGGDDSDEDDVSPPKPAPPKGKNNKKNKGKKQQQQIDSDSEDEGDALAALIGGGAVADSDDDDDSEDEAPPQPVGKKNKKAAALAAAALISSDEEEDDEDDEEEDVPQMAVMVDDWGMGSSKKKKEKKEKKEKKDKKDKKEKKKEKKASKQQAETKAEETNSHNHDDEEEEKPATEEEATPPPVKVEEAAPAPAAAPAAPRQKSKFELQMEAAMKKKDAEAEEPPLKPAATAKPAPKVEVEEEKETTNDDDDAEEPVAMYGIGDGTSTGQDTASMTTTGTDDLMYGPDGKKLSNKERKKILKQRQAAEREAQYNESAAAASREGAQFACSQTAVDEKDPQWMNSLDVNIPNFSISAAGKILFQDAALTIGHGRRYGLVGPNGKGKSTLLKMIASGDLKLPPRIDYLYVEQEIVADDTPAVEAVLRADTRRWDLLQEEAALMKDLDVEDETPEQAAASEAKVSRLQQVVDELTNMGADAAEARARRILYGLGFSIDMQTKPTKMFSGGWRMRISLARALFIEPTLMMLDEPTNHLDLNAVIWLEEYLKKWKKTLFVVSHDQDFLNGVCDEILHIEDLKLISYKGNYDSFKKAEKIKFEQTQKAWEKQEKRLRELKKSGQSKQKAQEAVKKNNKRESGARSQKKKNQAVAAGTEAVEASELIKRPKEYSVKFEFPEVAELSRPVMEVNTVHFRYSPKHPVIFETVDFGIDMDSRVTIVGPNGAGKSTLLKLLTGEVDPTRGDVRRNPRLRMGIYNQHFVDKLPMDKTPVEFLRDKYSNEDYQSVRNRLGKYGLEGHAHEVAMRDLSGGQKARVVFVDLSLEEPHILLLDEPTNNLDIESIDALCDAINEFNGGVVVVTHDQRLIDECECTLWVVEKLGVTEWTEGFDDYKASILAELEREVEKENEVRKLKLEAAATAKAEKLARLAKKVAAAKK